MAAAQISHDRPSEHEISSFAAVDITQHIRGVSSKPVTHGGPSDIYDGTFKVDGSEMKVALKVHRGADSGNEKILRVRVITPDSSFIQQRTPSYANFQRLRREIAVWRDLDHPCVQPMLGLCWGIASLPAMVSSWCRNGDINTYISSRKDLPGKELEHLKLRLLCHVFRGLRYLHRSNIVHADIKGPNVLVSDEGVARLCDFGFSAVLVEHAASYAHTTSILKGTWRWMAPELFDSDGERHTKESDIWAAGCLVLEVFSEEVPHSYIKSDAAVIVALTRNELPKKPDDFPEAVWRLVRLCCRTAATKRATTEYAYDRVEWIKKDVEQADADILGQLEHQVQLLRIALPFRLHTKQLLDGVEVKALRIISESIPAADTIAILCKSRRRVERAETAAEPDDRLTEMFEICLQISKDETGIALVENLKVLTAALKPFSNRRRYFQSELDHMLGVVTKHDQKLALTMTELFLHVPERKPVTAREIQSSQSITAIIFASQHRSVVGFSNGNIVAWDVPTRRVVFTAEHARNRCQIRLAMSLDATHFISASMDANCEANIRSWDSTSGRLVEDGALLTSAPTPHKDDRALALSHGGTYLLSGNPAGAKMRIRGADGAVLYPLPKANYIITAAGFSPDGSIAIIGTDRGSVRMWRVQTYKYRLRELEDCHSDRVTAVAVSSGNDWRASGSRNGSLVVATVPTRTKEGKRPPGVHVRYLTPPSTSAEGYDSVASLAFSNGRTKTGRWLAVATDHRDRESSPWTPQRPGILAIWNVDIGERVAGPFQVHSAPITALSFSPDDKWLISGSSNGEIVMWDLDDGWKSTRVQL